MIPQAASCMLAATVLVALPAGGEARAATAAVPNPSPASAPAQRLRVDAVTMRKVRAYNKYRRAIARQEKRARTAIRFARKQIGKPYRWGAAGPRSYDCSGLVMKAWRKAGVRLPRVTHSQYRSVDRKVTQSSLRPGDLVFFYGRSHVGMYVSKNRFLHAPNSGSRIRIDKLSGYRKRSFAGAVRPGAPDQRKWPASIPRIAGKLRKADGQDVQAKTRSTTDRPAPPAATHGAASRPSGGRPVGSTGGPVPSRHRPRGGLPAGAPREAGATSGAASGPMSADTGPDAGTE